MIARKNIQKYNISKKEKRKSTMKSSVFYITKKTDIFFSSDLCTFEKRKIHRTVTKKVENQVLARQKKPKSVEITEFFDS